jgi:hypothetical protein
MSCPECNASVSDQASNCPQCGYPIKAAAALAPKSSAPHRKLHPDFVSPDKEKSPQTGLPQHVIKSARSRGVYIILGLFLGFFGIHNFYAGYLWRGFAQLLIVLVLGWFVVGLVIVAIWVLIELFTVTHDSAGDMLV